MEVCLKTHQSAHLQRIGGTMSDRKAQFHSSQHPLSDGNPPIWASGWGEDKYGPWVEFSLSKSKGKPICQKMRWIGPGSFEMGSPDDEEGRYGEGTTWNEGPQHKVTLTRGYWLFDAPVTQTLWEAVMGNNPSYFKNPECPVEQISWKMAQEFLQKINKRIDGLELSLPTEAQWEYACRAGTDTRYYFGDAEAKLDDYAWYEKNSDSKTHPVGQKTANPWGLYDMHGNVWEWCHDDIREYSKADKLDPVGYLESPSRALRGGSWRDYARFVRSASRRQYDRVLSFNGPGFRCARVRE